MRALTNKEALAQIPEVVEALLVKKAADGIYYTLGELETCLDGELSSLVRESIEEYNGADFLSLYGALSGCWLHIKDDNLNNRVYLLIAPRRTIYKY